MFKSIMNTKLSHCFPDIFEEVTHGSLENIAVTDGSLEFEWKVPDFFTREQKYNYQVLSPRFHFLGAICKLELTYDFQISKAYHIVMSFKMKDGYSDLHTNASIEIKGFDGTVCNSVFCPMVVRPHFSSAPPRVILSQTDLLRNKTKIAPQGVLTIFCRLSIQHGTTEDSATQTEISEGIGTEIIKEYLHQTEDIESSGKEALSDLKGTFKLARDFKRLLLSGTHFDVTIKISDREFRAHRAILGARSSVFQSMFSHDTIERNTGAVEIDDCDPDVFQDFLFFLYSGKVENLSSENVIPLYTLADKYDVAEIKMECLKFMSHNFSVDNFCDVVALALRHSEAELLETATVFFIKNTEKVIFTTDWQSFLKQYPTECNELYIKAFQSRDQK